jgi:enoyl-[acyl-carrier protein] reductase I
MNIFIIHRDRRSRQPEVSEAFETLRQLNVAVEALNIDALSQSGQATIVADLRVALGERGKVRTLLHSIAFGSVRSLTPKNVDQPSLGQEDLEGTIHAMGSSLLYWTQVLHREGLFAPDARVLGLTSEGNSINWPGYAAISAAKCALESLSRSIAVEFAQYGVRSNIIQPGVTDTPALHHIPGWQELRDGALRRNPFHRLTVPDDVAKVVRFLSSEEAGWINGSVIRVDGGEAISGVMA